MLVGLDVERKKGIEVGQNMPAWMKPPGEGCCWWCSGRWRSVVGPPADLARADLREAEASSRVTLHARPDQLLEQDHNAPVDLVADGTNVF
jgi:hypothetical protein